MNSNQQMNIVMPPGVRHQPADLAISQIMYQRDQDAKTVSKLDGAGPDAAYLTPIQRENSNLD